MEYLSVNFWIALVVAAGHTGSGKAEKIEMPGKWIACYYSVVMTVLDPVLIDYRRYG